MRHQSNLVLNQLITSMIGAFISHMTNNIWNISSKRKKLRSVLLSSKMPLVIHQLSVLNRDMFSSRSVYITYLETSLLSRRPLPSFCVELGGTSDSITNISAKETIDIMNMYNFKLEIFNVCMFIIISLWFDIFHMLFVIWLINAPIIDVIN
jgi:hypothetical protein